MIECDKKADPPDKIQKTFAGDKRSVVAKDVCDTILVQIKDRFDFKYHLSAFKCIHYLMQKKIKFYWRSQNQFDSTVKSQPMLDSIHTILSSQTRPPPLTHSSCKGSFPTLARLRGHIFSRKCKDRTKCRYCGKRYDEYKKIRHHDKRSHPVECAKEDETCQNRFESEYLEILSSIELRALKGIMSLKDIEAATGRI
ncbi:unnamed protein product [Brassicogethes aeneus]|uniref:C2H2-type domain-containing protein n=1 Tax=Brassicogethes aeneus TaxID=1431903 RepID=A0A9P0BJ61_BRAAE|nr:unnamed protein product [Brassicogethes aeneus]